MNTKEKIEASCKKLDDGIVPWKFGKFERASTRFKKVSIMYILLKLIYKISLFILRVLSCIFS